MTRAITGGLLFGILMLTACDEMNGGVRRIPKEKMQKILLDVNIAEAYSTMASDSLHKVGIKNMDSLADFYNDIFAHYGITKQEFEENMNWYKAHPDELDTLVNALPPLLKELQSQLH